MFTSAVLELQHSSLSAPGCAQHPRPRLRDCLLHSQSRCLYILADQVCSSPSSHETKKELFK